MGRTRLRLAQVLYACERFEESRHELGQARSRLLEVSADGRSNRAEIYARLVELKTASHDVDAGSYANDTGLLERYKGLTDDPLVRQDAYIYFGWYKYCLGHS